MDAFAPGRLVVLPRPRGDLNQAAAILEPLLSRERFHVSEFNALCAAQIELCLARKQPEGARSWLDLLARVDPDNPAIDNFEDRLKPTGLRRLLAR